MREDLTEIKINRILSQGVVLPKRLAKWELAITVVVWICILLCLAISDISVIAKISGLVGVNLLFGVLTGLIIYHGVKLRKLWAYVDLCMEDAIKVKAFAKLHGQYGGDGFKGLICYDVGPIKGIKLTFHIGDKKYTKSTPSKGDYGVLPGFNKYVNKAVWIWYSPKQDEVLFPKKDWECV